MTHETPKPDIKIDPTRRDFLYLATGAMAAVGVAASVWPFLDSLRPAADIRSLASIEIDLSPLAAGQAITVIWRGKPIFIRHRTKDEIARAQADDTLSLPDPATDKDRTKNAQWLIVIGVCTHLGCVPRGQKHADMKGDYEGWFCPCHGSHYDISGRIRKGPAPRNLDIPPYTFIDDTRIRIG